MASQAKHPFQGLGDLRQKILVTKFEFGGSFCTSLGRDCHEEEVTLNLELLVTSEMSLEGVYSKLYA
jgi:hypothetical protein